MKYKSTLDRVCDVTVLKVHYQCKQCMYEEVPGQICMHQAEQRIAPAPDVSPSEQESQTKSKNCQASILSGPDQRYRTLFSGSVFPKTFYSSVVQLKRGFKRFPTLQAGPYHGAPSILIKLPNYARSGHPNKSHSSFTPR